jgi:hypothetical protein
LVHNTGLLDHLHDISKAVHFSSSESKKTRLVWNRCYRMESLPLLQEAKAPIHRKLSVACDHKV